MEQLQAAVTRCKDDYAATLRTLETMSEAIHRRRREQQRQRQELGERQAGVGAEDPAPPTDTGSEESGERSVQVSHITLYLSTI